MRNASRRRPWFQFSLRTLLCAMLILGIAMGWFVNRVRQQREAVLKIIRYGGHITFDYELDRFGKLRVDKHGNYQHGMQPPGPRWLRDLLGEDFFRSPVKIYLESDEGVGFEDRELEALAGAMKSLPTLREVSLRGSPISNAGLAHLHEIKQLRELNCMWTDVTDQGVNALQRELPRCHVTR